MTAFFSAVRAEFLKVTSVRSTRLALTCTVTTATSLSAALCLAVESQWDKLEPAVQKTFNPVDQSLAGITIGQLILITLAVLMVSSEYSTGTIHSSLSAVPKKGVFYASKTLAITALAALTGFITSFASFFLGQHMLGEHGTTLSEPGVLRAVLGGGLYMTLIGLFALGVAFMLRSTALSLGVLVPAFFLVSPLLGTVPKVQTVAQYLPDQAGSAVMTVASSTTDRPYGPFIGAAIMGLWVTAALVGGVVALHRRDA